MKLRPFKKDGGGYGNLDMANQHESDKETPIRSGSDGKKEESETYIGLPARNGKNMTLNKIQHTKVGDDIHFYVNGVENRGVVVKMGGTYVSVFKEDGNIHEIPINETFFVKDILVNKTWDQMSGEERTELLQNARAYSPRFLNKNWDDLPRELKTVLSDKATGMEQNHDKDNLEKEEANHAVTGYAQTQQNRIGKMDPRDDEYHKEDGEWTTDPEDPDKPKPSNPDYEEDEVSKFAPVVGAGLGAAVGAGVGRAVGGYAGKKIGEKVAEHRGGKNPTRGKRKKGMDGTLKAILELKSDVEEGKYGNVGSTSEVGVSTDTALDVSEESGYEERPHVSLEEVGEYPRADAKEHHANEVSESGKKQKIEPHEVKQDKKKGEDGQTGAINTSEGGAFNPVYNAYDTPITPAEDKKGRKTDQSRDQIKKGVPVYNVNSWGIKYVTKVSVDQKDDDVAYNKKLVEDIATSSEANPPMDEKEKKLREAGFQTRRKPCKNCGDKKGLIEAKKPEQKEWSSGFNETQMMGGERKEICPNCNVKRISDDLGQRDPSSYGGKSKKEHSE